MRAADALAVLAALAFLACARVGEGRGRDGDDEVRIAGEPLSDDQQARLLGHARAGGLLYWRLPGDGAPRCEAWRLVPAADDPGRGRLVLVSGGADGPVLEDSQPVEPAPGPADSSAAPGESHDPSDSRAPADFAPVSSDIIPPPAEPVPPDTSSPAPPDASSDMSSETPTLRLGYRLVDGHLSLTAPEHERPVAAPEGTQKAVGRALTCVFTGAVLSGPTGVTRRLVLVARERLFYGADACAAAGFADDPPGDDEVRAVGCAGALADPATRALLARPPASDAPDAAARLRRARALHHLRRGRDGALVCDVWRNRPARLPGHGWLEHRGRDERGVFVRSYAYETGPGYLTFQGPAERRRIRLDGRRTDLVQASSCIVTRGVLGVDAGALDLGGERLYLSKSACDAARIAGAPAPLAGTPALVPACE